METSTEVYGSITVNTNTTSNVISRRVIWLIGGAVLEECGTSILRYLKNEGSTFLQNAVIYYHLPHHKDDSLNTILLLGESLLGFTNVLLSSYISF